LQNNLTADAIAAAKAKGIPIIALLFVAGPVDPTLFDEVFFPPGVVLMLVPSLSW
jgi:hypothetical protein